ncbi:hypothetical protein MTO96_028103 [Rhipicephalus appendiculatus]
MPAYCCVPLCKQYGYLDSCGCKVSFHRFPNDPEMRKKWLVAIKREEGPLFRVSNTTKVCSNHFVETDYLSNVANGQRHLHEWSVPSRRLHAHIQKMHSQNMMNVLLRFLGWKRECENLR